MQHPDITRVEKTGRVDMRKYVGMDVMESEVFEGDSVIVLPNGERLLEENLEDYLIEKLGWRYTTA